MYEIFEQLLQKNGVSPYKVAKEAGVTQTALSNWKLGKSTPTAKTLQKIADYFDVPIDYLTTGRMPEPKQGYYLNDETAAIAQEIFENKELRMLFDASRNASPEDLRTVREMMLALKRKERGEND